MLFYSLSLLHSTVGKCKNVQINIPHLSVHCEYDETATNLQWATCWGAGPCGASTHGSKHMQSARAIQ